VPSVNLQVSDENETDFKSVASVMRTLILQMHSKSRSVFLRDMHSQEMSTYCEEAKKINRRRSKGDKQTLFYSPGICKICYSSSVLHDKFTPRTAVILFT